MSDTIVLASGSAIRLRLLTDAGIPVRAEPANVDEEQVVRSLEAEKVRPKDAAMVLAEMKAVRISQKHPESLVVGCDQVLEFDGRVVSKCKSPEEALSLLQELRGNSHRLHSSAVVCIESTPVWRHTDTAEVQMREVSNGFLQDYVKRNPTAVLESVGCYRIEEEGFTLISQVLGDFNTVCGLPLRALLSYLESNRLVKH